MIGKKANVNAGLELVITKVTTALNNTVPGTDDYDKLVDQLDRLHKIKTSDKADRPSWDAVLAVVGNIVGIGIIVGHERLNVITTKALGFVTKTRI